MPNRENRAPVAVARWDPGLLAGRGPPIARLYLSTLLSTTQDTPMLLSAPPLEHTPSRNVLRLM